jgi:hypothetical protein
MVHHGQHQLFFRVERLVVQDPVYSNHVGGLEIKQKKKKKKKKGRRSFTEV